MKLASDRYKRCTVPRDDQDGADLEQQLPGSLQLLLVLGKRVDLRPLCGPPRMSTDHETIICADQRRDVLARMARSRG